MGADTSGSDAVRPLLRVRQVREFTDEPVSPDALDAIAAAGLPQTRSLQTASAAVAIVLPEAEGKGISHAYDEGRAAERMLIAASLLDLGAGIAWILPAVRPLVGSLLNLPEGRYARTIVALGHPSAAARRPKSKRGEARLPREETVFYETWGSSTGDL